jgi:hypothetical protein
VALLGEDEEVVRLAGFRERDDEAGGVAEVHVFVGHPVDEEQAALEPVRMDQGGGFAVAVGVFGGRAHVPLGVAGVVAVPVGDGGAGHAHAEDLLGLEQAHEGHVAAVAPAVDADAGGIEARQAGEVADAPDLVFDLDGAHAAGDVGFEGEAPAAAAAVVELEDGDALLREVLGAEIDREGPVVDDALDVGAAVDGDDDRRRAVRGGGAIERAVEQGAVGCGDFVELGDGEAERRGVHGLGFVDRDDAAIEEVPGDDAGWMLARAPAIEQPGAAGREDARVPAVLGGEALGFAAGERDTVEVALER